MALPADLVLVRHGQSEANLVKDEIRAGNVQAYTDAFAKAKNWQTRLTDKGRAQAKAAGEYIRAEVAERFDARFFSYFVRTRETAGLLGVDGPNWQRSPYLHERDWGTIDSPPPGEFETSDYKTQMEQRKSNPLFWRPPNGERVIDVAMRFDRVLQTIHRDVNDGRIPEHGKAILVTHGEVIDAARVPLEKMDEVKFYEWINDKRPENESHNGQVIHYTRRLDPDNPASELARKVMFRRSVCPWDRSRSSDAWMRIEHPTYTDEELLEGAERYPSLIKK